MQAFHHISISFYHFNCHIPHSYGVQWVLLHQKQSFKQGTTNTNLYSLFLLLTRVHGADLHSKSQIFGSKDTVEYRRREVDSWLLRKESVIPIGI